MGLVLLPPLVALSILAAPPLAQSLFAQGPRAMVLGDEASYEVPDPAGWSIATSGSSRPVSPNQWKRGLIIGGTTGAVLGLLVGAAFCANSAADCGALVVGPLGYGATGGAIGAFIGALFPKHPTPPGEG